MKQANDSKNALINKLSFENDELRRQIEILKQSFDSIEYVRTQSFMKFFTAKTLIERLQQFPPDAQVQIGRVSWSKGGEPSITLLAEVYGNNDSKAILLLDTDLFVLFRPWIYT